MRADFQQANPGQQPPQNPLNRIVYDQQIMIRVRSHQREEYFKQLGLKLSLAAQPQTGSTTLYIDITDQQDPLFLYQMICTE